MTNKLLKTTAIISVLCLSLGALSSCQESPSTANKVKLDDKAVNITSFPSVLTMFYCKPQQFSFTAAHRGTHEGSLYPENALESLMALHEKGVPFAEIDVAKLKDGTQILYHDGVWDRGSTGKGPIAVNDWEASQKLLLKDTNGALTAYRPSNFADVLNWAKNKMYLEIDFKSSVSEANVITAIKDADMIDQVILIAYNKEQAVRLHDLAPTAALSVGVFKPGDIKALEGLGIPTNVMTAWTGRPPIKPEVLTALRTSNIPVLAPSFYALDDKLQNSGDFTDYMDFAKQADLVVTNFAFDTQKALEIKGAALETMNKCIAGQQK